MGQKLGSPNVGVEVRNRARRVKLNLGPREHFNPATVDVYLCILYIEATKR